LQIVTPFGKKGQIHYLQVVLPRSMIFIESHIKSGRPVCISCDTGKDVSVGVALAALSKLF
ncbi:hypothetical protein SERLA73DRAFT_28779, partial [Serpula lacrymans var. lacrymans S7.3]